MSVSSFPVATLGTPRIGPHRELKFGLERFWAGEIDEAGLREAAVGLRVANWARQKSRNVDRIPSNDFSFYDQVLDTTAMVGAVPPRYGWDGGDVSLDTYFAMARGTHAAPSAGRSGLPAMEMTKWFDTNYHYIVPEFGPDQEFILASTKVVDEYREARAHGYETRPVLLGPVTYLELGKSRDPSVDPLGWLDRLLPVYAEVLRRLEAAGAGWVQIDEPVLVMDLDDSGRSALERAYGRLAAAAPGLGIMLATYFGGLGENLRAATRLPVGGLHLDLIRASEPLAPVVEAAPDEMVLSLGVIDGRNVWRADLESLFDRLEPWAERLGPDRMELAPSCPLLHVPIDLELEEGLDPEVASWLAFAVQKMDELSILSRALSDGRSAVADEIEAASAAVRARSSSPRVVDPRVRERVEAIDPGMTRRASPFDRRRKAQQDALKLPSFPTTTIGSFPQTSEVRAHRAAWSRNDLDDTTYRDFLEEEVTEAVRWQEEIGIDVLVHGEFERNDMVQYFGERLSGFAFTEHGWVQSYGSRCVRPPILFGDVSRPRPMTVGWSTFAQSLTERPVKGMLTGPVTILQWSFVRDDLPRSEVCRQIALALRAEVADLEEAGIRVIQIDEPALREGLPLRRSEWDAYLERAVECFRLASSGVRDETQIHTHMCYSEFNEIIDSIAALDADVISIESSRSKMELLDAFVEYEYPNDIGPGVYDIHSPRVPSAAEVERLLEEAASRIPPEQIWVNPDCGLKTRKWEEVRPALENLVAAARAMRSRADT